MQDSPDAVENEKQLDEDATERKDATHQNTWITHEYIRTSSIRHRAYLAMASCTSSVRALVEESDSFARDCPTPVRVCE